MAMNFDTRGMYRVENEEDGIEQYYIERNSCSLHSIIKCYCILYII
jgi:hypothetical protein